MMRYSVESRDRIFVYKFSSFYKNIGRNSFKSINIKLSSKYGQKLFNHAKQSATDALKTVFKKSTSKNGGSNYWFDW